MGRPTREELEAYARALGVNEEQRKLRGKRGAPKLFRVSWYSPGMQRRVGPADPFEAHTRAGAIQEAKAAIGYTELKRKKQPLPTNFMATEVKENTMRKTKTKRGKNGLLSGISRRVKRVRARRKARRAYGKELKAEGKLRRARAARAAAERGAFAVNGRKQAPRKGAKVSYQVAMAAGRDEANRRMRKAGRKKWNKADYNAAVKVFERLHGNNGRRTNMHPLDLLAKGTTGVLGFLEIRKRLKPSRRKKNGKQSRRAKSPRRTNTTSTTRLYREFQGRNPAGKVQKLFTPAGTPQDVSMIGPLIELRLKNRPNQPIRFGSTDRAALNKPTAFLGQAQRGASRRLYIGLVKPYGRLSNGAPITRAVNFGEVASVAYWAAKPHLLGHNRMVPWEHKCGDRGGRLPNLILRPGGILDLRSGDYTVRAEGIDN